MRLDKRASKDYQQTVALTGDGIYRGTELASHNLRNRESLIDG